MNKIAIIGLGCRLPGGVNGPEDLWKLLCNGIDATRDVPKDRWDISSFYHPNKSVPGKTYTYHGGYLDSIDAFDAGFFGISPREACYLDPQQRMLLEISWEAFEDAGIDPTRLAGKDVGVYIGAFTLDYKVLQFNPQNRQLVDVHTATGSMMTMVSNRLSYAYDFRGPSLSVDTACSSSLVSIHLACQALKDKECSIALAGGVNLIATPEYTIAESKGGFLSPEGRSKTFDSRADGYARGEGAGIIILKPLDKAIEDNDNIYGIIMSTAVNQDGRSNGITVPNGKAQEALMKEAYRKAEISPSKISYVEAHGTGTPVGDPIEANVIANILGIDRNIHDKCFIGSIKTNIGHLEAAAGVAGIIKLCLILKNGQIPPHLHFQNPNPQIPFEKLCIKIPTKVEPLTSNNENAYVSINSFGFGGTNAHIVLSSTHQVQQAQTLNSTEPSKFPYFLPISARSEFSLSEMAKRYMDFISAYTGTDESFLKNLCYSASQKRSHHNCRLAIIFRTREELRQKLDNFLAEENRPGVVKNKVMPQSNDKIVFVYTGMGPIWWAMGRQLLQTSEVFKSIAAQCDRITMDYAGWSILEELTAPEEKSRLDQPMYAQPANFVLQVGLTKVWESLGVVPHAVLGHSVGEVAAVFASGSLTLEDAMKVSIERSRWQQKTAGNGTMLAASLSEQQAESYIQDFEEGVSIAAVNSPKSVTLAGNAGTLEKIRHALENDGIFARFLKVNVAYHSYQMDPIKDGLKESLKMLCPSKAAISIYSTVTGSLMEGTEYNADYWWHNVRNKVRFQDTVTEIIRHGHSLFLEVGPHPVLNTAIEECLSSVNMKGKVLYSIRRKEDENLSVISTLGSAFTLGYPVDWKRICPSGQYIKLPQYAWQHEKYWIETQESRNTRLGINLHPILGRKLMASRPTWEVEMDMFKYPFLRDHKIQGSVVYPGAGYIELSLACAKEILGESEYVIENISFNKAMFLSETDIPIVQTTFNPSNYSIEIFSTPMAGDKSWTSHSSMTLSKRKSGNAAGEMLIEDIKNRCTDTISKDNCYHMFNSKGFQYGDSFQGINQLWKGSNEVLSMIEAPRGIEDFNAHFILHPSLLDSCFQSMVAMISENMGESSVFLPVGIERLIVYKKSEPVMWGYASIIEKNSDYMTVDLKLMDQYGKLIAQVDSLRAQNLSSNSSADHKSLDKWVYSVNWIKSDKKSAKPTGLPMSKEFWVILCDKSGFGSRLIKLAQSKGIKCISIQHGLEACTKSDLLIVNPESEKDFEALFEKLKAESYITKIINLWPLDSYMEHTVNAENLESHSYTGCIGLLNMLKAVSKLKLTPKIWIATRGAQTVNGIGSDTGLLYSSIWGISRVFGHYEKPELWGGIIDIDPISNSNNIEAFFEEISSPDGEDQIAFRSTERFVIRIEDCEVQKINIPVTFDKNGSYIITGAFGALGMLVCKWMVQNGARRLILVGRTRFPERIEWGRSHEEPSIGKKIDFIKELEASGASIHIANIDISEKKQLSEYIELYKKENWPEIRGVIHSAGIVRDKTIDNMDADTFKTVLAPKVQGTWNLHETFLNDPLDFFVIFSSLSSLVITSMGQSNYASGNAFIDSLANYRMSRGLPALSINWGPWSKVGMAEQLNLIEYFQNRGVGAIPPEAGISILSSLFGSNLPQAFVADATWTLIEKSYPTKSAPMMICDLSRKEAALKASSEAQFNASGMHNPLNSLYSALPEDRQSMIEHNLRELVANVLRFDASKIDCQQSLNVFGLDSMMATEIKHKIKMVFDVAVPLVELLQGNTICELSSTILNNIDFSNNSE